MINSSQPLHNGRAAATPFNTRSGYPTKPAPGQPAASFDLQLARALCPRLTPLERLARRLAPYLWKLLRKMVRAEVRRILAKDLPMALAFLQQEGGRNGTAR
jgi:hypothetical protein